MARTPKGQKKSNARMEVESVVSSFLNDTYLDFASTQNANLPINKEGRINISELSTQMGLSESQRKNHLYGDDDILFEINRHAIIQGILPIDRSRHEGQVNESARHKIAMSGKRAKQSDDQLVEVQSQNEEMRVEIRKLKAKLEQYEACFDEYYQTGVMPPIVEIN